jgi:hypothetical protein
MQRVLTGGHIGRRTRMRCAPEAGTHTITGYTSATRGGRAGDRLRGCVSDTRPRYQCRGSFDSGTTSRVPVIFSGRVIPLLIFLSLALLPRVTGLHVRNGRGPQDARVRVYRLPPRSRRSASTSSFGKRAAK